MRVAALYTCFNRKEKTLSSLAHLYAALEKSKRDITLSVYLTDDNSSDGTSEALAEKFPDVQVLKGSGYLYWAGGMRNSWSAARKESYDAYLLLNDDTNVNPELLSKILQTDSYCLKTYSKQGIYIGTTTDSNTQIVTYGGWQLVNSFTAKIKRVPPGDLSPKSCDLGNANIMWVSKSVVDKLGILSEGYIHGMADFDYTLIARKNNIPILVVPGILGVCVNDHSDPYEKFINLPFKRRIKMLYDPVGLDFKSQLHHMKKHFPLRYPIFLLMGWIKTLFPKSYYKFQKSRTS
jgi:GT2 family glycosyltransferase